MSTRFLDILLVSDFPQTPNGLLYTINGNPFISPSVPVLLQILSGANTAQDLLPQGVIELPFNKTIELSLAADVIAGPHPFHLHGVSFLRLYLTQPHSRTTVA